MQEVARHLGMTLSAISKIEKGYRRLDSDQISRLADFLDCQHDKFLVIEGRSPEDVVDRWRREQEKRCRHNEQSGLKRLGSAIRALRKSRKLSLVEVASASDMTLSVYHRIEVGQRKVTDDELSAIAKALGTTPEALDQLAEEGVGAEARDRIPPSAATQGARGEPLRATVRDLPVFGQVADGGLTQVDWAAPTGTVAAPPGLEDAPDAYVLRMTARRLGAALPVRSLLYACPGEPLAHGDLAVVYAEDGKALPVRVRENDDGVLEGVAENPAAAVVLGDDGIKAHRVVFIGLP